MRPQAKRDTRNPTALSHERNLGPYRTTARATHTAPPAGRVLARLREKYRCKPSWPPGPALMSVTVVCAWCSMSPCNPDAAVSPPRYGIKRADFT